LLFFFIDVIDVIDLDDNTRPHQFLERPELDY